MRRSRRIGAGIACALLVGMASVPAAGAAKARPSTTQFEDCTEALAFFLLDPAVLQAQIPERFTVATVAPNRGELLVVITRCSKASVNGASTGEIIFSEVGVYIEEPPESRDVGAQGFPYYQLWHLTDAPALRNALARVGIHGDVVRDASFTSAAPGQADAVMPWEHVGYEINALDPAPTTLFTSRASTWWHIGKRGLVATLYPEPEGEAYRTGATLFQTADAPLADLVGSGTSAAHQGVIVTYPTLSAVTTLLGK